MYFRSRVDLELHRSPDRRRTSLAIHRRADDHTFGIWFHAACTAYAYSCRQCDMLSHATLLVQLSEGVLLAHAWKRQRRFVVLDV